MIVLTKLYCMEIEAAQIKLGGGKILLFDLLDYLYSINKTLILWIGDRDIYNEILDKYNDFFVINYTSVFSTLVRYMRHRKSVIFFCSIPPFVKCEKSLVYFHNPHLVKSFKERFCCFSLKLLFKSIKSILLYLWILLFKNNCNLWCCQIADIANKLEREFSIKAEIIPFYSIPNIRCNKKIYDFCYVAYPYPHKNHLVLFEAIKILANKHNFSFVVTIPKVGYSDLIAIINDINRICNRNVVFNFGILERNKVFDLYSKTKYLVFPSKLETLGLPLIEAQKSGLKILASNLPFSYASIGNVITFNPLDAYSISEVMESALFGNYDNVDQKTLIHSSIDQMVNLVSDD